MAHHDTLTSANNLGSFYVAQGRYEEARVIFAEALTLAQANFPRAHFLVANLQARYGACLAGCKRFSEAEKHLTEGYSKLKSVFGLVHQRTQRACSAIIDMYEAWGKPDKAASFRAVAAACS